MVSGIDRTALKIESVKYTLNSQSPPPATLSISRGIDALTLLNNISREKFVSYSAEGFSSPQKCTVSLPEKTLPLSPFRENDQSKKAACESVSRLPYITAPIGNVKYVPLPSGTAPSKTYSRMLSTIIFSSSGMFRKCSTLNEAVEFVNLKTSKGPVSKSYKSFLLNSIYPNLSCGKF